MDSSAIIAVVAVLVSNAVAVVVAVLARGQNKEALREARRQQEVSSEQARTLHDLDAVRDVLDEAGHRLDRLSRAGIGVEAVEFPERLDEFRRLTEGLDMVGSRLQIRLGREHQIVQTFRSAENAAFELLTYVEAGSRGREPKEGNPFELANGVDHFRRLFLDDAAKWAGARLVE